MITNSSTSPIDLESSTHEIENASTSISEHTTTDEPYLDPIALEKTEKEDEKEREQDIEKNDESDKTNPSPYTIFSHHQLIAIVTIASWSSSFSGLSSNIYFPSIYTIAKDLKVTPELINLTVTLYLIFQGISPSIWAPLSDSKGRRMVILITFTIYLGANIGLALTKSYPQLAVLRAVQSSASASSVAIGAAIVGDVIDRPLRAGYMGMFNAASLLANAIGPVIGGAMSESLGWRSIFWFLVIYGGSFLILAILGMPETLRKLVGIGNIRQNGIQLCPIYDIWVKKENQINLDENQLKELKNSSKFPIKNIFQPFLMFREPSVLISTFYLSLHYASWQMTITACSTFFANYYGLNEFHVGLTFLANGAGCMAGTLISGKLLDWTYKKVNKSYLKGDQSKPFNLVKARLGSSWIFSIIESFSILLFGWTIDKQVYIAVPIIATFFVAVGLLAAQTAVQTFLVDSYPDQSASANASMNLARCLMAAIGTSVILPMSNGMGIGWAFTFLCFLLLISNGLILYLVNRSSK